MLILEIEIPYSFTNQKAGTDQARCLCPHTLTSVHEAREDKREFTGYQLSTYIYHSVPLVLCFLGNICNSGFFSWFIFIYYCF